MISTDEIPRYAPAELACHGYEFVTIQDPVRTGLRLDDDLRLLRFLREITSHTIRLEWALAGHPLLDPTAFVHLVPPTAAADDAARACVETWREGYRYGAFYYRCGPGFVTIRDIRVGVEAARLTIDGEGYEHFRALADGENLAEVDGELRNALQDAVEAGLAVRGDDTFLVLPYRMRNWPVPYVAV